MFFFHFFLFCFPFILLIFTRSLSISFNNYILIYQLMERQPIKVEMEPRKHLNPDIIFNHNYNEFQGELKE